MFVRTAEARRRARRHDEAGRPASYTRVTGDPHIRYWHTNFGAYIQDDIKFRKNLIFSPGIRYESQLHVNGANWAPRFGLNWAPGKSARTAIRWTTFRTSTSIASLPVPHEGKSSRPLRSSRGPKT